MSGIPETKRIRSSFFECVWKVRNQVAFIVNCPQPLRIAELTSKLRVSGQL